jgi:hypothetical protein
MISAIRDVVKKQQKQSFKRTPSGAIDVYLDNRPLKK